MVNNSVVIVCAVCLAYYVIGGMATTNILRLLKGSYLSVEARNCYCDNCNLKISLIDQTPIISYFFCKGKCRHCGVKIPRMGLILEIIVFSGMSLLSALFGFSLLGVLMSFIYFELIKLVYIFRYGRREKNFLKQYILSILINVPLFLLVEFMALLKLLIK